MDDETNMLYFNLEPPTLDNMTDNLLTALIHCKKEIISHPKKATKEINNSKRNDFTAVSAKSVFTTPQKFSIFIRQSSEFTEDFSIGLVWRPDSYPYGIILVRFNGAHGKNRNVEHQRIPHVHELTLLDIQNQKYNPHQISETNGYVNMDDATLKFMKYCNIIDWERDFPHLLEMDLFDC